MSIIPQRWGHTQIDWVIGQLEAAEAAIFNKIHKSYETTLKKFSLKIEEVVQTHLSHSIFRSNWIKFTAYYLILLRILLFQRD